MVGRVLWVAKMSRVGDVEGVGGQLLPLSSPPGRELGANMSPVAVAVAAVASPVILPGP